MIAIEEDFDRVPSVGMLDLDLLMQIIFQDANNLPQIGARGKFEGLAPKLSTKCDLNGVSNTTTCRAEARKTRG